MLHLMHPFLSLSIYHPLSFFSFFFFNDTATTEIYTLSLHDALPIFSPSALSAFSSWARSFIAARSSSVNPLTALPDFRVSDRKSTRLNSSHSQISYAVFCLKKKKTMNYIYAHPCIRYSS